MELSATQRLVVGFQECSLLKEEWTHHAHLRVGLWHVLRFGPDEALGQLRDGIRRLNESLGTPNTDRGGYHETITRFYVQVIAGFLSTVDRDRSIDELAAELIAAFPTSDLPLRYYSRELLFSVQARRQWIEPDLARLD
jgi:hypothetical protein